MSTNMKKALKERAKEFSVRLPFMEGKEKGELKEVLGMICTINDFGFLKGDQNNDYAVFTVKEIEKKFFFGGQVLTDQLQQLEAEGYHEDIITEGLPVLFTEKKSKNNKTYTNVEFYPDED